jgi:hypothetical protein
LDNYFLLLVEIIEEDDNYCPLMVYQIIYIRINKNITVKLGHVKCLHNVSSCLKCPLKPIFCAVELFPDFQENLLEFQSLSWRQFWMVLFASKFNNTHNHRKKSFFLVQPTFYWESRCGSAEEQWKINEINKSSRVRFPPRATCF